MKVVAINGSPRKEGNTYHALSLMGEVFKEQGIDFEILHIGNKPIVGCLCCGKCSQNRNEKCIISSDPLNEWVQIARNADGLILGSPVYYSGIAGTMKSFLDRFFLISGANGNFFRHKVGAAVVSVRRSGGSSTFDALNHYLNYSEMIIATSNYWNIVHGHSAGESLKDEEGNQIVQVLAKNMAWLIKMKEQTKDSLPAPERVKKTWTNFIR